MSLLPISSPKRSSSEEELVLPPISTLVSTETKTSRATSPTFDSFSESEFFPRAFSGNYTLLSEPSFDSDESVRTNPFKNEGSASKLFLSFIEENKSLQKRAPAPSNQSEPVPSARNNSLQENAPAPSNQTEPVLPAENNSLQERAPAPSNQSEPVPSARNNSSQERVPAPSNQTEPVPSARNNSSQENAPASSNQTKPSANGLTAERKRKLTLGELPLLQNKVWKEAVLKASEEPDSKSRIFYPKNVRFGSFDLFRDHVCEYRDGSLKFPE